jgi:hypothetical protein
MEKQNAVASLKETIRLLEIKQAKEGEELKEQFRATIESLKPSNILKNSLRELTTSVEVKNSLFETIVSILSGYLTKKIMIKSDGNPFLKIFGALLQFGVTSLMAKNAEAIRLYITQLIDKFLHPAEEPATEQE